jgi:hypothetical protein
MRLKPHLPRGDVLLLLILLIAAIQVNTPTNNHPAANDNIPLFQPAVCQEDDNDATGTFSPTVTAVCTRARMIITIQTQLPFQGNTLSCSSVWKV